MDPIGTYHQAVDALVAFVDAPRPLMHVHAGMLIYLACQVLMGTRRGSLLAVLVTVKLAVLHEVMNRLFHGSWRWEDTTRDLVLTLFWPTLCYAVSRFRRWRFTHRAQLRVTVQARRRARFTRSERPVLMREERPLQAQTAPLLLLSYAGEPAQAR